MSDAGSEGRWFEPWQPTARTHVADAPGVRNPKPEIPRCVEGLSPRRAPSLVWAIASMCCAKANPPS